VTRIATVALLLAIAARASAQPAPAGAPGDVEIAKRLYAAGDYAGAAERFVRAYTVNPQPAYLFDAAQAYRFAKDCPNAAKYYRQFIEVAQRAQAQNLDKVKGYLAEMEACAKPAAAQPAPAPVVEPAPVIVIDSDPGRGKRQLGLAIGGAGIAGLATGAIFTAVVKSDEITCSTANPCSYTQLRKANNDGSRHEHYEIAAYAIGTGALAAGIVLYMLGRQHGDESPVTVAPTRNGAALSFSF
jgi:tetratricopeptide (TPR) repeat protein